LALGGGAGSAMFRDLAGEIGPSDLIVCIEDGRCLDLHRKDAFSSRRSAAASATSESGSTRSAPRESSF